MSVTAAQVFFHHHLPITHSSGVRPAPVLFSAADWEALVPLCTCCTTQIQKVGTVARGWSAKNHRFQARYSHFFSPTSWFLSRIRHFLYVPLSGVDDKAVITKEESC